MKRIYVIIAFMILIFSCKVDRACASTVFNKSHEDVVNEVKNNKKLINEIEKLVQESADEEYKEDIIKEYDIEGLYVEVNCAIGLTPNKQWKSTKKIKKMIYPGNTIHIPAKDGNDNDIFINLNKLKDDDEYSVSVEYGTFSANFDCDADFNSVVKYINKKREKINNFTSLISRLKGEKINNFTSLTSRLYDFQLLYFENSAGKAFVIPYSGGSANWIDAMGVKQGSIYSEKEFMESLCSYFEDYTEEELKKLRNQKLIGGGSPVLKIREQKTEPDNKHNKQIVLYILLAVGIVVAVVLGVIVALLKKKKSNKILK